MTLWDCFKGYGNELEYRKMVSNPLRRAPSLLGTDIYWGDIVMEFTRRNITRDTDRLPALAGLAEQYRKETGKQYVAGLWLEDMPEALLWKRHETSESLTPPTTYRAPSWSWASLEGPVKIYNIFGPPGTGAKVIAAHCEYYPPGTLSTVTSGWLDIEGPMAVVTGLEDRGTGEPGTSFVIINNGVPLGPDYSERYHWYKTLDQRATCTDEDVAQSRIYLLHVSDGSALILQEVGEQYGEKNTFRRLGYADTDGPVPPEGWENRVIRLI